ncbi:MAG: glycosyltransferase [Acidobacteria bacterium]|nr:glycosyltransferase [Acidobacteriota bacterium]
MLNIIVPVYNEANNFPGLWRELSSQIKTPFKAYVVYDFDEDSTMPVVKTIISKGENRLELVKNTVKRGVVGAILTGFSKVNEGPILVVMADLSDDLTIVDKMVDLYNQGFQLVVGSRYMKGGKLIGGPFFKQLLSRLAGVSLYYLRGIPTHDSTNAFKLYDSKMLKTMQIESKAGFELNLEITVKAFLSGYKIAEIPSTWRDRTEGESKFKLFSWLPQYLRWYFYAFSNSKKTNL